MIKVEVGTVAARTILDEMCSKTTFLALKLHHIFWSKRQLFFDLPGPMVDSMPIFTFQAELLRTEYSSFILQEVIFQCFKYANLFLVDIPYCTWTTSQLLPENHPLDQRLVKEADIDVFIFKRNWVREATECGHWWHFIFLQVVVTWSLISQCLE